MLVDFPISLVALALAWKYSALATAWILVVGTLWWYLLSRGAGLMLRRIKARREAPLGETQLLSNSRGWVSGPLEAVRVSVGAVPLPSLDESGERLRAFVRS